LKLVVERRPDDHSALNSLAWACVKDPTSLVFDPVAAARFARRSVDLAPRAAALNTLGYALYWLEEWPELIEVSRRSLELAGEAAYADDAFLLAGALFHAGKIEEANAALERARELRERSASTPELERLATDVEGLFRDE
jgi:tetratricopeptide (TPR) repeat protein